jgi:hypothetical protein
MTGGFRKAAAVGAVLYPGDDRRRWLFMLRLYIDDGGKDRSKRGLGGTPSLCAAGYVAHEDDWTRLESIWPTIMGEKVMHATDLIAGHGAFKGMSQPRRRAMLSNAVNAVNAATLFAIGIHIPVSTFHATPGLDRMLVEDTALDRLRGFAFCVYGCLNHLACSWPTRPRGERIAIVLARGTDGLGPTVAFTDWLLTSTRWGREVFQGVAVGSNDLVGLQAADIIANRTNALALQRVTGVGISRSPKTLDKWTRKVAQHPNIHIAGPSTAERLNATVAAWQKWRAQSEWKL